jgi:hypothetical protein
MHLHSDFASEFHKFTTQFKSHFTLQLSHHLCLNYYGICTKIIMVLMQEIIMYSDRNFMSLYRILNSFLDCNYNGTIPQILWLSDRN